MYPPKRAYSLEEAVDRLRASLSRAADNLTGRVAYWGEEKGDHVALQLNEKVPRKLQPLVRAYIKGYMHKTGWKVGRVSFPDFRIEFVCSPY